MYGDAARRRFSRKYVTFELGLAPVGTGIPVLTNLAAGPNEFAAYAVPENSILEKIGAAWVSSTGTTSAATVRARRATTVLASSGSITGTGRTAGYGATADASVFQNECLNLDIAPGTNDDDFVGLTVTMVFIPQLEES